MLLGAFSLQWDELHLFAFEHTIKSHVRVLLLSLSNRFGKHEAAISFFCFDLWYLHYTGESKFATSLREVTKNTLDNFQEITDQVAEGFFPL